mmetsp:Transcript_67291/g.111419  ORF Transcript_67291/g.111419 Transcript_67291/m.111419 type:complete len:203 (-) Transcript_67291:30-638(-)
MPLACAARVLTGARSQQLVSTRPFQGPRSGQSSSSAGGLSAVIAREREGLSAVPRPRAHQAEGSVQRTRPNFQNQSRRRPPPPEDSGDSGGEFMADVPRAPPEEPDDGWDYWTRLEEEGGRRAASTAPGLAPALPVSTPWSADLSCSAECAICLSDFQEGDQVSMLQCRHAFHAECVERWLQSCGRCPVCRSDLSSQAASEG